MTKFIEPLVERPPGFADVYEKVFAYRADAVEAGFFLDGPEFVFVCGERNPRGPREGAPGACEIIWIVGIGKDWLVGIRRHA
jgi:hypothetical protein